MTKPHLLRVPMALLKKAADEGKGLDPDSEDCLGDDGLPVSQEDCT
jgi:hypothetical protein